jgi:Zn-dependent protease
MLIKLFQTDPQAALMYVAAIIISFTLHELGHAWAAEWSGDPTPRNQGRLSFNPIRHIDPMGLILIALVGFGYAKPVMTRPDLYKYPWSDFVVSFAGVICNFVLVMLSLWLWSHTESQPIQMITSIMIGLNCLLIVLNLIPLPPFDGGHMLTALMPRKLGDQMRAYSTSSSILGIIVMFVFQEQVRQGAKWLEGILSSWF